ncbi:DMT family transporter [Roseomonas marmotae]|uniref:DMT family transporter n=1 Tax=Roseomonas marmotae TaxID=2768161 RepID=A0ABS3K7N8_9PROT|nr:DMT family transporter [Roseomonas marmotae]MBO1073481.1 DMT family transporter [Roseomonas marmotae]QTI80327.1 DMT family transporter [Roseomonas marmotae]
MPLQRSGTENARLGIVLMVLAMFVFGCQDALSRHLAGHYNIILILVLRFWFFALFVAVMAMQARGGIRRVATSRRPMVQLARGLALTVQLVLIIQAFVHGGLVETHAVFACYPLMIAGLAGPLLGERVTARRWLAIGIGALGVLVILRPGSGVFSPASLLVLAAAVIFALYSLLTRLAARHDPPETSFFYLGTIPAVIFTLLAPFYWQPLAGADWFWMALLCVTGALGHYMLIRVYDLAEANTVQPLAYFQLIFASAMGIIIFGEHLAWTTVAGTALVIAGGVVTLPLRRRAAQPADS